jgi:enoyl-CoA hydratase/carnithine racemase
VLKSTSPELIFSSVSCFITAISALVGVVGKFIISVLRVPDIVGQEWVRELALTGRDFSAEEALQMCVMKPICNDRNDLYAKAGSLAAEIADNSPLAVEGTKEVLNHKRDHSIADSLEFVARKNSVMLYSEDLKEAFQTFSERRVPIFNGR